MSKNTHPHGEQLSAYLDGMLDVANSRGIAEHLRACVPCAQVTEQLQQTKTLLRTMPVPPRPSPEFWTDAYRRLRVDDRERAISRRSVWDVVREPGHAAQRRWAAGAAAAVALGAILAGPLVGPHPPIPPNPVAAPIAQDVQDVTPDVSALVESHTDSVSRLPLADPDRQKMIAADAQQGPDAPEAAAYADVAF